MIVAAVGSFTAFLAVTSVLLWAAGFRASTAEARVGRLNSGKTGRVSLDAPFGDRVFFPLMDNLTKAFVQFLPQTWVTRTAGQLSAAGRPMTVQAFFTLVLILGVFFPVAALALTLMAGGGSLTWVGALAIVFLAFVGFLGPVLWLRRAVRSRKMAIWKSLADCFDLVTVCVEAGLGLDAALRQVAEKLRGPLADEISQMLREVGMGRPRREALEDMAARCDVRDLETFVNAIIQAEQLGTSLGRVLRSQAVTLRVRRRQRAEETSRKAPVKLVFPLVLFIMPTFFIVTLGPVFVRVVDYLNG